MLTRVARPQDAAGIARVGIDTWRTTYRGIMADDYLDSLSYEKSELRWQERLAEPECFAFVAESDAGEIIGYANGGKERDGDPIYLGEVYALYVLKSCQGFGIGRRLVEESARWLLDVGISTMLIWVLADNPSRAFYERLGGRELRTKTINIGGRDLEEAACGWDDISSLTERKKEW